MGEVNWVPLSVISRAGKSCYPVVLKLLPDLCRFCRLERYCHWVPGGSVDAGEDKLVSLHGLGQRADEVDVDGLESRLLCRESSWLDMLVTVDLDLLADCAGLDKLLYI